MDDVVTAWVGCRSAPASAVANNAQALSVDVLNEVDAFVSMTSGTYTGGVPTYMAATNSSLPLLQSTENTVVQSEAAVVGYETGVLGKLVGTSSNLEALITPLRVDVACGGELLPRRPNR